LRAVPPARRPTARAAILSSPPRAELGAATVEALRAEGATMTIEQAIAHARQQLTDIPTT
jgi:hypothetical protein